jgi:gas vesicle protein GvpN
MQTVAAHTANNGSAILPEQSAQRPRMDNDIVLLSPRTDLFENHRLDQIVSRALTYLRAGIPIHLRGPAGTGKTTMAMQIAAKLGRPAVVVTGDDGLTAGHLVGREVGVRSRQVVDRFVHSVRKIETETTSMWSDAVLTQAFTSGLTFVYDEFTRSPPEANNPLLSALEERVLIFAGGARKERYVYAHPEFRAILTSNPEDYAGVSTPQDALIDRMITFGLDHHDRETEIGIVAMRSGIDAESCARIVDLIRALRDSSLMRQAHSMRSAIMIARIVTTQSLSPSASDERFIHLCFDVLAAKAKNADRAEGERFTAALIALINKFCPPAAPSSVGATYGVPS